jgi:sodium-dependent dicarboxylate transporter 2/3/5
VLAVAGLMVTWWITEALPMPAVALLPLVLFPLLGINGMKQTAASYGNEVIFLFMGGFMLGLAIEKWSLHRRIALSIVSRTGTGGNRIILGFVISTGLLSMWLSNTATTMMMFPIALSVVKVMKENGGSEGHFRNFTIGLLLAIAYASNFGGLSTIIGTPPNVQFVAFFEDRYGVNIGFLDWMLLCTPLAFSLMFIFYFITTRWLFPNRIRNSDSAQRYIRDQLTLLGPLRPAEKRVLFVFLSTVLLWITKDLINQSQSAFRLDDNMIAIAGALGLFLCPSGEGRRDEERSPYLLEWDDTGKMAWGILLLFGGGIALADALEKAGLIQQLGQWMAHYAGTGAWLLVTIVVVSVFLSEVMSNVAQVIVFSPVVCSLAEAMGMNPLLLGIPMTLAASCASMLPMGTPPNAIVFASGHLRLKDMVRAGLVMNVVAIVLISALCWWLLPVLIRVG